MSSLPITLRPYQQEALDAVQRDIARGHRRLLLQLATGAGKTILFASAIRLWQQPTLILVHRQELLDQAVDKLKMVWPDVSVGIVKGSRSEWDHLVIASTVQTLQHRDIPTRFTRVIIDEAHHAVSQQWQNVLERLGFMRPDADQLVLGVTATTQRLDGIGLHALFDRLSYRVTLADLVHQGYLVNLRGLRVKTGVQLDGIKVHHGDYDDAQLSLAVDTDDRNNLIAQAYRKYALGRPTIGFSVNIAHAQHLADTFNRAGIVSDWVAGSLSMRERQKRLHNFHTKKTQVLWNSQVLTEGYDEPHISCVILARPTQSPTLYAQMVGRGTRLAPQKTDCLILDVADIATKYPLQDLGVLLGEEHQEHEPTGKESVLTREPKDEIDPAPVSGELRVERLDLFTQSIFRWQAFGDTWILPCAPGQRLYLIPQKEVFYQVVMREGTQTLTIHEAVPLDYAMGIAEDWVRAHPSPLARKDAAWLREPATAKQRERALQLNITLSSSATKEEASNAISLASQQQALTNPHAAWRQKPITDYPKICARLTALQIPWNPTWTAGQGQQALQTATTRLQVR